MGVLREDRARAGGQCPAFHGGGSRRPRRSRKVPGVAGREARGDAGGPRAGGRREGGGGRGLVRPRGREGGHAGGRGRRAQLTALMAQASPDDLSLLAEADREGARRASVRKGALAVGLALLGALLAFALFAALSAAISALAGSSLMDGLRRSMAEAVARAA